MYSEEVKLHFKFPGESEPLACSLTFRSKSLALHAVRSRSINSDTGEDGEGAELSPVFSGPLLNQHSEDQEAPGERQPMGDVYHTAIALLDRGIKEAEKGQSREEDGATEEQGEADRLFVHLRDNMEMIRAFCKDMMQQIPIPEHCVIEGNNEWFSECMFLLES